MDNGLVPPQQPGMAAAQVVLILFVMDNGLVHRYYGYDGLYYES